MIDQRLSAIFISLTLAGSARCAPGLVLVENSQPRAVVVCAPVDQEAAQELVHYVEKATGAKLTITSSALGGTQKLIVGAGACPLEVRKDVQKLGGDGFLIRTLSDGSLALAGAGRDGTAFAVYTFLERYLGIRWLWPGDLGESVPKREELRIPQVSFQQEPAYIWRDLGPGGALWGPMDKWTAERKLGVSEQHQRAEKLWERHNRFGGVLIYGGHAFGAILPPAKYGPTHPEYYALVDGQRKWEHFDGKHGTQPCTTNPEVIRLTVEYARHFFDQHPEYEAFAISLNDGGGFCECERCRRLDTGKIETTADDPEGGKGGKKAVITDRVVTFANQVADAVAKTDPAKKLILFAYGPYKQPPVRVKTHPNLIIQYTFHASSDWNPETETSQYRETGAWSGAAQHLGVYEYFIQGNWPDLPRLMPEPIQRSVARLHEQGYRYYQTQSGDGYAINGLNYYILGRLLWKPSDDIGAIQTDFILNGFGKAAPAVARYFRRLEEAWKDMKGRSVAMDSATASQYKRVAEPYPPQLVAACWRDLDEAAAMAQGRERERVAFLKQGLRYVDITVTAIDLTIPLFEAGWKFGKQLSAPAGADMAAFKRALAAWEERDRYIESLKQDFVIAYFWVRYNEQNRTFVPLEKMREFKGNRPTGGLR